MTSIHRPLPKQLLLLGTALGLLLLGAPAEAQRLHLVWPEVGFGAGQTLGNQVKPTVQLDFSIGAEQEGYPWSLGGLMRLDVLIFDDGRGTFQEGRVDFAPMVTFSSTFETAAPYFRAGAGPLLSARANAVGVGAHGELSIGFKSIFDLFIDGRVALDPLNGGELTLTGGLRLNAYILSWFNGSGVYVRRY